MADHQGLLIFGLATQGLVLLVAIGAGIYMWKINRDMKRMVREHRRRTRPAWMVDEDGDRG